MKRALITGISGQGGSYLAEYLLGLGYEVAKATGLPVGYNAAADKRSWALMRSFFREILAVKK